MNAGSVWRRVSGWPGGRWLYSRLVCWKAPYFASIRPMFVDLQAGRCIVRMRKRRAVLNHIGTVHAIAMCNLAELAAGTMIDSTLPPSHRWIPKGMTVEYLRKAESDLQAVAALEPVPPFGDAAEFVVPVEVTDTSGQIVFHAAIRMWITPRKAS
jgi:acyl-coenzyme A thioesterase PaaI-like protein